MLFVFISLKGKKEKGCKISFRSPDFILLYRLKFIYVE